MARSICFALGLMVGVSGCGSTIGALDELPDGPDVSGVEWPRLVDTPVPPEGRLTAGQGAQALQRLTAARTASGERSARTGSAAPVSDALVARGVALQSRATTPGGGFDETTLRARAERLKERTGTASQSGTFTAPARPTPLRPLDAPAVSSAFEDRAQRARERAARAGS